MAEENEEQSDGGGSKKKLILIIVGALILVGASVGGTLFFLGGSESQESAEAVEEEVVKKAHYFSLDPPFVVNFPGEKRSRFLQITLDAMTYDEAVLDVVRTHMPAIRNNLILLYSEQQADSLTTAEGKDALRGQTLKTIQQVIEKESGEKGVEEVYFTNFVMQ